jgi:hypothetical protein
VDPWLEADEPFEGAGALEELPLAEDPVDAARILAFYVLVRLMISAVRPLPGLNPDFERAAARSLAGLVPEADPDRRALLRLADDAGTGVLDTRFARDVDTLASVASRRSRSRSAFSLLHAAYTLLRLRSRESDAALLARRLGRLAADAGAPAAARRWNLRAAAHERRAAAD